MSELFRKIKRVEPIIVMRQRKVDEEAQALAVVRREKQTIVAQMKESQRQYLAGYETLNGVRSSGERKNLTNLEEALDAVKNTWHRLMVKAQEVERKERAQMTHLLTAERDLRAIEKLKERYQSELTAKERKVEQKIMDENALRRFMDRE